MKLNSPYPALILIDIQKGLDQLEFYGGVRNNLTAEKNCQLILNFFRKKEWPIYHIQHCSINEASPLHPSKPGNVIKEEVSPLSSEPVLKKSVNSAFIGTGLHEKLHKTQIDKVIIVGLTIEHCVSTSVRMSANLGYQTTLVSDATAAFNKIGVDGKSYDAELVHQITLANLKDEFAEVVDTQSLLKELNELK